MSLRSCSTYHANKSVIAANTATISKNRIIFTAVRYLGIWVFRYLRIWNLGPLGLMDDKEKMAGCRDVLQKHLEGIDDDTLDYFESMLAAGSVTDETLRESLGPFIESYGWATSEEETDSLLGKVIDELTLLNVIGKADDTNYAPQLLEKSVLLGEVANQQLSSEDKANLDKAWGFADVRKRIVEFKPGSNEETVAVSARTERKAAREQTKWLEELESQFVGEEDNNNVSTMMLRDMSGKSNEKDIHVHNFNITYGGSVLLDGADLRLVYGRRYGLVGRNGIGKTTLLKHMASFEIEGFPRHHRVLHVKQEVKSSASSVLQVVLEADVERAALLEKEKELQALIQACSADDSKAMQRIVTELSELENRMTSLGVHDAEHRAATILSGLQFSLEMQAAPTESLSGGWRMRVAIAAALLIEPDLLMLDEPTNHLDLEAVLWLDKYLRSYPKTVLLVSHDRAFLNDVCSDIILFDKLQLTYFRGNYDSFEGTRKEMRIVQQKQHEAQKVKLDHMQDFVDKFRYNAKRASLVQSRIKAIEKEAVVDAVEDEEEFHFSFYDSGQLGRPIVAIEGVTFGYDPEHRAPLFRNVHATIDQSSRIALVGPNGAGKSTLLNLIQGKLAPWDGIVRINPQLKLGIFTQHHMDSFDLNVSPLGNMMTRFPDATQAELRAHLGKYHISGNDALKPMKYSSGGQKSRAAFAQLTFTKPHVVIMDEPSNHLDMTTIDALIESLQNFSGGVLVISHDQHFINKVCNEVWVIKEQKVNRYAGSFNDYKKSVLAQLAVEGK